METPTPTSRRTFIASAGAAWAAAWLAPRDLLGAGSASSPVDIIRKEGATAKVAVEPLRGNISVLTGSGGNIALLHGGEGKLLIDSGVGKPGVLAALNGVDDGPLRYLVNTHWHFDHTDGNAWVHAAGATIVAQENTRKRMSTTTRVEGWDHTFPPSPAGALPAMVFREEAALFFNGASLALKRYEPAHTDTDIRVTFTEANVVHVGDTWWNGHYPFIDYSTGGTLDGTIRAAEANVDAVTDKTLIIPGHGPVGGRREMTEFRDMLRAVRDAVAPLKKRGMSADEVVAVRPTAKYDAKWGGFVIGPEKFTRILYEGA